MRLWIAILAAGPLLAVPALAISPIDGAGLHAKFVGDSKAIQTNGTGYGDNFSELDQLWATSDGTNVHLGVSGNMEANGNSVVVLFDTMPGGSSVLNAPGSSIAGHNGALTFDDDFMPDFGFALNNSGGTLYADMVDFGGATSTYIGNAPVNGGPGGSDPAVQFALNNTNTMGVTSSDPSGADTADTGLEMLIGSAKIGAAGSFKMMVYLQNQNGQWLSNQFLPGLPNGTGNLNNGPVDLRTFTNVPHHYVTVGSAIPEPGSLAFLATGLLPLLGLRRRK
ncbi:MAG TPA: hypothetical protein VGM51_12165 [Armatimonadota bacterium]